LDALGSIARVTVSATAPVVQSVGGGLWYTDLNDGYSSPDVPVQLTAGYVAELVVNGGYLFVGGAFSRGGPGNGFPCLNNLAVISLNNPQNGVWKDVGGGCDSFVTDLEFWGSSLYVAGNFQKCGGILVNYVTAINYVVASGTGQFQSLNNGLDAQAYTLEYFQGRMIVGGQFYYAGGLPVGGVASWDGQKWRALEAACTNDCTPPGLGAYFTIPQQLPSSVWSLHTSSDSISLYALSLYNANNQLLLSRWQYFGTGDSGQWTFMGNQLNFYIAQQYGSGSYNSGHNMIMNNGSQIVVAASPYQGFCVGNCDSFVDQWTASGSALQAYSTSENNWVDNNLLIGATGEVVFVVESSACSLFSPFRLFLSFFL